MVLLLLLLLLLIIIIITMCLTISLQTESALDNDCSELGRCLQVGDIARLLKNVRTGMLTLYHAESDGRELIFVGTYGTFDVPVNEGSLATFWWNVLLTLINCLLEHTRHCACCSE
jgi:hypothetical protein